MNETWGLLLEMGTEEYENSRNGISCLEFLFILLYRAMLFHIAALFLLILIFYSYLYCLYFYIEQCCFT